MCTVVRKKQHEFTVENTACAIKSVLKKVLKEFNSSLSELLVCAEYTGQYTYPLACVCEDLDVDLRLENPAQIKHSSGISRGKNDKLDARKIAGYAFRFQDKVHLFSLPEKHISSLRRLVSERDMYVSDKSKYQGQLTDEKRFMNAKYYAAKRKRLKDEAVREIFGMLQEMSQKMISLKGVVFNRFDTIIEMKDDIYKSKSDRQSDTFTTEDNAISIKLGNRVNEGWDDTVEIGVEKVKQYLKTLAKDEESGNLVDTVMRLLSKNRKGQLKANKVLELKQLAMKSNDNGFKEAIQIIEDAYRPVPTCQFIEVRYKDEKGNEISLPLSMSAIN